jgi:hypothetical protein
MSIPVPLAELGETLARFPWAYLVTVSDDQRAHSLAVPTRFVDGALLLAAGRGTRANATARPNVTMVFPPASPTEYSLIVDGEALVVGDEVRVVPSSAVLHRPAIAD